LALKVVETKRLSGVFAKGIEAAKELAND